MGLNDFLYELGRRVMEGPPGVTTDPRTAGARGLGSPQPPIPPGIPEAWEAYLAGAVGAPQPGSGAVAPNTAVVASSEGQPVDEAAMAQLAKDIYGPRAFTPGAPMRMEGPGQVRSAAPQIQGSFRGQAFDYSPGAQQTRALPAAAPVPLQGTGLPTRVQPAYVPQPGGGTVSQMRVEDLDPVERDRILLDEALRKSAIAEAEARTRRATVTPEAAAGMEARIKGEPELSFMGELRDIAARRAEAAVAAAKTSAEARGAKLAPEDEARIRLNEMSAYESALRGAVQRSSYSF